jgi:hypothetical protein
MAQKVVVTFGREVTEDDLVRLQAPDEVIEALLIDDTHINININSDPWPGGGGFPDRIPQ